MTEICNAKIEENAKNGVFSFTRENVIDYSHLLHITDSTKQLVDSMKEASFSVVKNLEKHT